MSYRVETASTARAGCQGTECKKFKVKIDKDELRLGTYVEAFGESGHGGWVWRHWGCVSGKIMEGLRKIVDPEETGEYTQWDRLDGFDSEGGEKNSLDHTPDLQEKVKRCIIQGFIDPEDFNGDPEMNKLGVSGLKTAASKKKARQEEIARNNELEELQAQVAEISRQRDVLIAGGATPGKLDKQLAGIKEALDEKEAASPQKKGGAPPKKRKAEEGEDEKPAKKKRVSKAKSKKEKDAETEDEDIKHEDDVDEKPAKKKRAIKTKVKAEEDEDDEAMDTEPEIMPTKKARGKKATAAVKTEPTDDTSAAVPEKKKRAPRAKKVKDEPVDDSGTMDLDIADATEKKSTRGKKAAVKTEPIGDNDIPVETKKQKRAPRGKKGQGTIKSEPDEENQNVDSTTELIKSEEGETTPITSPIKNESPEMAKNIFKAQDDTPDDIKPEEGDEKPAPKKGRGKKAPAKGSRTSSSGKAMV